MYVVIMAGGKGTRFWPRSRTTSPKQLLDIVGEKTMIQETVERVLSMVSEDKILIVTNTEQAHQIALQLPDIPRSNIIEEPVGKNTAPCICLAATRVRAHDPDAVMVVLPADHYIGDPQAFRVCIGTSIEAARTSGALMTIGIAPIKPETGYGYIQFSQEPPGPFKDVYKVKCFHEKPDLTTAEEFLRQGNFLWNSGMFIWKASAILSALKEHLPDIYSTLLPVEKCWGTSALKDAIETAYQNIAAVSIDYGVMEKSNNVYTMRGDFGWNDIGSWSAMYDISDKDFDGNSLRGDVVSLDSHNMLVYSPKKLTAIVGLQDIIIVETDDALLVCAREKAQDVKKIVDVLEKRGKRELL